MGVTSTPRTTKYGSRTTGNTRLWCFARTAEGNVAPKRILRNAPPGTRPWASEILARWPTIRNAIKF